jgi:hypothetical protein
VNNPGETPSAFDGPDLVEPEPFELNTELGSLDTDRILRDTGSATVARTSDANESSRKGFPLSIDRPSIVEPSIEQPGVEEHSSGETGNESDPVSPPTRPTRRPSAQAETKPAVAAVELETSGINILSIVSLILGLTLSPLTVVFGYIAVGQIRRADQRGEAMAWFSIALGWLWLVGYVVAGAALAINWFQLSA